MNQYKDSEDADVKLIEDMNKKELEAAIEVEEQGLITTKDKFEESKNNRKWQEAHAYKQQIDVIEGLVEKLRLQLVKNECKQRDTRFEYMNGDKMDKIRESLEKEILEATEAYKNKLEEFIIAQDEEMDDFKQEVQKKLEEGSWKSPEAFLVDHVFAKSL